LRTGSWGHDGCPYVLEFPYLTIPDMIKDKLIHKFLKVKKVTYESRN
jgi:homoserine acetyltransferase